MGMVSEGKVIGDYFFGVLVPFKTLYIVCLNYRALNPHKQG